MRTLLAILMVATLMPTQAFAQATARAPDWARALLVTDVDAVTVSRSRLTAPEGGLAVRLSVAPAQGGVGRLVRFTSTPESAALTLWRYTGHIRNGWVLWGGEAPVAAPLEAGKRELIERLARAALSAGTLGSENGSPAAMACANGDYAWIEVSDAARSVAFERRCAMDGASGALIRAMIEAAGNRDEEELYQSGVAEVMATERAFSSAVQNEGLAKALAAFGAGDGMLFPGGQSPIVGVEAFAQITGDADGAVLAWTPKKVEISARGDMAWSWGDWTRRLEDRTASSGSYVTVWRRDPEGAWRFSAFMLN